MSLIQNSDTSKIESPLDKKEEQDEKEEIIDTNNSNSLNLGLGDIIKFIAPNNNN